ncbi:MAG: carboxymuconolactone decarboxylase family protein [Alphaproteobacteria bacterium]|nr:carboxymuconolactone decarboxylase family protein [Alphaproteobacteria bacterium]
MARLPFIEPDGEPEALKPVFDQLRETRGRVPGMYRLLAHQPGVLAAHRAYFSAALDTGLLPRAFKEKIAYRVARLRGSVYSSASHREYALQHGVPEEVIDAVDRGDYSGLDAADAAALQFADEMVAARGTVSDTRFESLKVHFTTPQIVEIIALVGIMELASTFGAVFGLEPDRSTSP